MQFLGKTFGVLVALALTVGLGVGGYFAIRRFIALYARLDFPVAMFTGVVVVALLLACIIITGSIRHAAAQSKEAQLRPAKAEAYKLFVDYWEEALRPGQTAEGMVQLSRHLQTLNQLLLLHGCAAVLKAHTAMQSANRPDARAQFATALMEIRKDLGLDSRGLTGNHLMELLASDSDSNGPERLGVRQDTQPRVSLAPN